MQAHQYCSYTRRCWSVFWFGKVSIVFCIPNNKLTSIEDKKREGVYTQVKALRRWLKESFISMAIILLRYEGKCLEEVTVISSVSQRSWHPQSTATASPLTSYLKRYTFHFNCTREINKQKCWYVVSWWNMTWVKNRNSHCMVWKEYSSLHNTAYRNIVSQVVAQACIISTCCRLWVFVKEEWYPQAEVT